MKLFSHYDALKKSKQLRRKAKRMGRKNQNHSEVQVLLKEAAPLEAFYQSQMTLPFKIKNVPHVK